MKLLVDLGLDLDALEMAWTQPDSFLLLPANYDVSAPENQTNIEVFVKNFSQGHFGLLTSGTTGQPKIVVGIKKRTEELVRLIHQEQQGSQAQETIVSLPLSYSYAFVNQWLWALIHGKKLTLSQGFVHPADLIAKISSGRNLMLCFVGPQMKLLKQYVAGKTFPEVIRVHFAGARFPESELPFIFQTFPRAKVFNNYGCVEAMPRLSINEIRPAHADIDLVKPLPGVQFKSDDKDHLFFQSPYSAVASIAQGQVEKYEDWIATGDSAAPMPNGSWRLLGRNNEIFKRYGEKVMISDISDVIMKVWESDFGFYRVTDSMGEEGVVLVLSPEPKADQLQSILMEFRNHLRRPFWPIRVESASALELSSNGKTRIPDPSRLQNIKVLWKQYL